MSALSQRPALGPGLGGRLPWFRIALGSIAIVAGLVHLARDPNQVTLEEALPPPAVLAAPAELGPTPPQPHPLYALDGPEFAGLPRTDEARRTGASGREDVLRIGAFETPALHLQLHAERSSESDPAVAGFFVEAARRASEAGLGVVRSAQPATVATKLGPAEMADVVLAGTSERGCLAFRLHRTDIGLRLGGWLCGAPDRPAERAELACAIDRLVLASGARDPALKALFSAAERDRDPACGPSAAMAEADALTAPFTAARTGSASRRKREKTSGVRSASRGQRG